jgi:hypothetical protein
VKLADLAMGLSEEGPEEEESDDAEGVFESAAAEAFELAAKGKTAEAAAALKGAIEACVADYMSEE